MSSSAATGSGRGRARRTRSTRVDEWVARFESPMTTYYLLLGIIGLLVGIGLVMVLSASMIVSLRENDSSFTIFLKQFIFAIAGGLALWWASRRGRKMPTKPTTPTKATAGSTCWLSSSSNQRVPSASAVSKSADVLPVRAMPSTA